MVVNEEVIYHYICDFCEEEINLKHPLTILGKHICPKCSEYIKKELEENKYA